MMEFPPSPINQAWFDSRCRGDSMSMVPGVKREADSEGEAAAARHKRRKQAAPTRAPLFNVAPPNVTPLNFTPPSVAPLKDVQPLLLPYDSSPREAPLQRSLTPQPPHAQPPQTPPPPITQPSLTPQQSLTPPTLLHAKLADVYERALADFLPFHPLVFPRPPRPSDAPRIFNPEAYCDLCCKEFCNKYFLKTHRANKHGIYDNDFPVRGEDPRTPTVRRASDEDSGPGTLRRLSPDSSRHARDGAFAPDVLRRLGVVDPEAFCEICCKEYCNKYFLRTHRERIHGVPPQDTTSSPTAPLALLAPSPPTCKPLALLMHSPPAMSRVSLSLLPPTPPPLLRESTQPSPPPQPHTPPSPIRYVKYEREEDTHEGQTSPLNLIVEERNTSPRTSPHSPASASEELRKLQTMISQLNELTGAAVSEPGGMNNSMRGMGPETPGADDSRPASDDALTSADERRASAPGSGSSFCEICNKELCNKYFMRTHMQRMHGISLEGGAQLGGVTCDICNKELCSKYFLRVHKHNTHGIPAPPAGPGAPPTPEQCPLCPRRFRAARALRAHLVAEHAAPRAPESNPPPEPAPPPSVAPDLKPYCCSYCPFTTNVLAFLFAHERAHAEEMAAGTRASTPSATEDAAFSCSRCEYRAGTFGEMESHLRLHHGAGAGGGALLAVPAPGERVAVTMQPFVLEEAAGCGSGGGGAAFVPSLVFLPVRRRATRRATVTFTVTPA